MPASMHHARSTRRFLVMSVLGGVTLAVGAAAVTSYRIVRGIILENLQQQALQEVSQGGTEIDSWLSLRQSEVQAIANTPVVQSLQVSEADFYLTQEVNRLDEFFFFVLADDEDLVWTTQVGLTNVGVNDRDWYIHALNGQATVNDPVISRTTGETVVQLSAPIATVEGPIEGVLMGAIRIDRLLEVTSELHQGEGSYAFALNSAGVPITHPNAALVSTPEAPAPSLLEAENTGLANIAKKMVAQQQGVELVEVDGQWQYVAYVPLMTADWSLALVIPRDNIESNLRALNLLAAVLGGLLGIAMLGAVRQVYAYEIARRRGEQEALLNRLTGRIRESLELNNIVQTTVSELVNLGALERAVFGWYYPTDQSFRIMADSSPNALASQTYQFVSAELEKQLAKRATIHWQAVSPDPMAQLELTQHQYIAVEISEQENQTGYLIGLSSRSLTMEDEDLLQAVADQLAIAIRQSYLYSQTQSQVKLLNETLSELQRTQLHLVQSEKMSSLGQLVAGVAHEINNPINFIYGNLRHAEEYANGLLALLEAYGNTYPQPAEAIREKAEEIDLDFLSEDLPKLLSSMKIGAERIRGIVASLRVFSRLDEAEFKAVDIHQGLDSTVMILQNRLKAKSDRPEIAITCNYGTLPAIECYAGQLNQVFMNILNNAIDALEEALTAGERSATSGNHLPHIWLQTELEGPNTAIIKISDNGPGIPEAVQQKLFNPFFTTKPIGKGTGMGLAISYEIIIQKHGGTLECVSSLGEGTEFAIKIPVKQPDKQAD